MAGSVNNFYNGGSDFSGIYMAGYVAAMQQSGKSIEEIKEAIGNMGDLPKISDIKLAIEDVLAGHSQQYVDALQSVNKRLGELKGSSKKKGSLAYEIGRLEKVGDVLEGIVSGKISPSETLLSELSVDVKAIMKKQSEHTDTLNEILGYVKNSSSASNDGAGSAAGNNGAENGGTGNDGADNGGAGNGAGNNGNDGAGNNGNGGSGAGNGGAGNNGNNGAGNDGAGNNGAGNDGGAGDSGSGNNGAGNNGNGGSGAGNNGSGNDGAGNNGAGNNGNDGAGNDGGAGNNGGAGTNPPNPPSKPKLKKLRFVQKSLQQTKMLAEAKQPWYKRLATFAIKHPVVSVAAGAGLGLGLFGAGAGIAALAGGTSFLTAVNMLIPSIPGFVGLGAVGGGTVSLASNTLPKGQWGLYAKASRLFGKVKKIDKTKQWVASFEKQQETAKQAARERHRNSKGLVRKLKVHRVVAKAHKLAERTSRKVRRLYERRLAKTTTKALETKNKLNAKEIKSDRTQALAGYLQKKKKAENKFAKGKIDSEEFAERIADLDEDYADIDGGAPGLSEVDTSKFYTFDAEALEAIKVADADGKNETFQNIKKDILTRNSRETRSVGTKVVLDPEYLAQLIEEEKKKGNADKVKELTEMHKAITDAAAAAEADAKAAGVDGFEALVDLTDEELAQIEEEHSK